MRTESECVEGRVHVVIALYVPIEPIEACENVKETEWSGEMLNNYNNITSLSCLSLNRSY